MPFPAILRLAAIALMASMPALTAGAQSLFDRLVMPGPLVEGHAKYEKDCKNCHEPFSKSSQTRLCLACHKDIAADREQHRGLHGLRPDAVTADCKHCHGDHKGRTADIVQFDRETSIISSGFRVEGRAQDPGAMRKLPQAPSQISGGAPPLLRLPQGKRSA